METYSPPCKGLATDEHPGSGASAARPTGDKPLYLPALDGLRFFAFVLVFVHHAPELKKSVVLDKLHFYGWVGVELFFVISAFLFFHLFKSEKAKLGRIDVPRFYIRRFIRIYPLMLAFPVVMLIAFWKMTPDGGTLRVLGLALFADNFISWFRSYSPVPFCAHLWTLSFEFQVYAVIPIAFMLFSRFGRRKFALGLGALFGLCLALRVLFTALSAPHPIVWVTPLLHPDSIVLGIFLAIGLAERVPSWAFLFLVIGSGYWFIQLPHPTTNIQSATLCYALGAVSCASLTALALRTRIVGRIFSWRPLAFLGSISYGLYVYHLVGMYLTGLLMDLGGWHLDPTRNLKKWSIYFGLSLTTIIVMAILSFYGIERPLLRLKDRFAIVRGR